MTQFPITFPVAGAVIGSDGVSVTVDEMTATPAVINEQIASLVETNEGFFAPRLMRMLSIAVNGAGAKYREVNEASTLFLDDQGKLRARAPGAKAASIMLSRRPWKIAQPESISGSWEITDEARRMNDVAEVSDQMTAIANTVADTMNTRALEVAYAYLDAHPGRTVDATDWSVARASGVVNVDPLTMPAVDLSNARTLLVNDKTGVAGLALNLFVTPEDAFYLDILYPGDLLEKLLKRYKINEVIESPHARSGKPLLCVEGGLGYIAFEKELDTETARGENGTWKDDYATEVKPVFVANKAINAVVLDLGAA